MTIRKALPRGRPFKKGNKSNLGRKFKIKDPKMRELKKLSKKIVREAVMKCFTSTRGEIEAAVNDPKTLMGEIMVFGIAVDAAKSGDYEKFEWLAKQGGVLKREVVAWKESLNVDKRNLNFGKEVVRSLSDEELDSLYNATQKLIEVEAVHLQDDEDDGEEE